MEHTDFFDKFKKTKDKTSLIFETINKKTDSNGLGEAFFGLFGKDKNKEGDTSSEEEDLQADDSQVGDSNKFADDSKNSYELIRTKNGIYYFGDTIRKTAVINNAQSEIDNFNWEASEFRWLFDSNLKFELQSIAFDFKRGVVLNVKSINWEGPFVGNTFSGVYQGDSFKGNFFGINDQFKAHPTAFVDGVFYDSTNTGLLGLDNIMEFKGEFNLIQVPVGYSIEILTNNQIRHTIVVDKRLDAKDSTFAYTLYLGYDIDNNDPIKRVLSWEQMRQDYEKYRINEDTIDVPQLIKLQSGEKIIELKIIKTGVPPVFQNKIRFNPNESQEETFYGYKINFDINNESDFEKLTRMKAYAKSTQFGSDLKQIAQLIDDELIDIAYLKSRFPNLKSVLENLILKSSINEVDLRNKKGPSSGTRYNDFNPSGEFMNTFTGRRMKTKADIQEFLHTKYRDHYANYGEYPKEYEVEYNDLYQKIIRRNKPSSSYYSGGVASTKEKESDKALRRLESFILYFINKIDLGDKTNSMKSFIINKVINKNIQKYMINKGVEPKTQTQQNSSSQDSEQQVIQQPTTQGARVKNVTVKNNPSRPIMEEGEIKNIVREIFRKLL